MKKPLIALLFFVAAAAGMMTPGAVFAEPGNSVNLGAGGGFQLMPHCSGSIIFVEYEHMLDPKISVLGRGSGVHYTFDDGRYMEDGRPMGIDVGLRYYTAGNGMKGFFIGGALGYWKTDWTFIENKGTPSESRGTGDNKSIRADIDIGERFPIGSSPVSIMPVAHLGKFFTSNSCEYTAPASRVGTACSQTTEVKYYAFLALLLGVGF